MAPKYKIIFVDPELAYAPFKSKEGQAYFSAMKAAANLAFANRQIIMQQVREIFEKFFGKGEEALGLDLIYDTTHNVAKLEEYGGKKLVVHRKGAIHSFPGKPVLLGGSMESGSCLLLGSEKAKNLTFSSTAHGSGRAMSRTEAKRQFKAEDLKKKLEEKGIYVRAASLAGLVEEAGSAYKDINEVVSTLEAVGLSQKVVSLLPLGNLKG